MKKILLTSLGFIFYISTIFSQEIIELPKKNGIWKDESYSCWVDYITYEKEYRREYHSIISAGDTTFNDTLYFKLIENNLYKGSLRQDSCKIYYRSHETNKESLLYDFCVTDKFYSPYFKKEFAVTKIDSIIVGETKRKRIFFDDVFGLRIGDFWVDGIGSSGGLLKPTYLTDIPTCDLCCGIEQNLVCHSVNGNILFLKENYSSCDSLITHLEEEKLLQFQIYPNPSDGEFLIEFQNTGQVNFVDIVSIQGTLINRIINPIKSKLKFSIEIPGIYFVRINQANKIMVSKIVIN